MRFVRSLFAACLISTPVSARSDRGMKELESVIDEKIKRRLQNNYNSTKEMIRELWEFDYDDLFLELTLTDHPSTNPSLSVKPSPLPPGSIYPTSSPTSHAHSLSLMTPSDKPSPPPSLELTGVPSREPSQKPSREPSLLLSLEPTEFRRDVIISPFVVELISVNELSNVADKEVADIAGQFLTNYLYDRLPSQQRFLHVELKPEKNSRGRRLNVKKTTTCSGIAVFNSKEIPIASTIDEHILNAFANPESKRDFLDLLKNSGTSLSQVLNVGANDLSRKTISTTMPIIIVIIIVITAVAIVAIALSLFVQHRLQRGSEKKVKEHGLNYAIEENMKFEFLEPEPMGISDDDHAIERNLIRSRYERTIMEKANTKLKESFTGVMTSQTRSIRFDEEIVDISNWKDEDEEATVSSIQFANSMELGISSLRGLKSILPFSSTNTSSRLTCSMKKMIAGYEKRRAGWNMKSSAPLPELNSQSRLETNICEDIQESPSVTSPSIKSPSVKSPSLKSPAD